MEGQCQGVNRLHLLASPQPQPQPLARVSGPQAECCEKQSPLWRLDRPVW